MATDYRKQIEKDASAAKSLEPAEREKVRERLQAKVGKEPMTVKEVAAWIELTGKDGESYAVTEKTIKNYINSLCEMREELKLEYFKNDRGEYIIKPEIQGLFFCLIDTDIVRKHKNNLSHRANINKQMIENVDRYLNPVDALMVKSSQEYTNAELEEKLLDCLFRELYLVIQKLVTLNSRCRYEYMLDFVKWLDCFRKKLMGQKVKLGIVLEYAEECYPNVNKDIFENDTLEQFLISNMILKLEGKNEAKTMRAYYNMTPEGHLLANCLYGDSSFLEHIKKEVDIPFHNNKIYQEFEEKANQASIIFSGHIWP